MTYFGLTLVVAAVVAASAPQAGSASADPMVVDARLEARLAARVNVVRRLHGLTPLRISRELAAAACRHSRDMGLRGYFDHDSAGGTAFWSRIERTYASRGFSRWEVGENIAWSSSRATAADVVSQWMRSAAHRANMLSRSWRELGLGALRFSRAHGAFGGRAVTIVTLDLGVRTR